MDDSPLRLKLFLCGDVMTGRGIDQVLPHPGDPRLYESYMRSALGYVELAEEASGKIDRPVDFPYVWGDALQELEHRRPAARIVNLETAVAQHAAPWPGKGIHYRMHPANVGVLEAAALDCCVLANNHILDFGREGLEETLATLARAGIRMAGAGRDTTEAAGPAVIEIDEGHRVLVFALATASSGVAQEWAAAGHRAGVNFLPALSPRAIDTVARTIAAYRREGDVVIVSLHWGPNWGFQVTREEEQFAHALLDVAGADVVHGHSSHHAKSIEVHAGRLILYGCGDFITDYEGIGGHESYRPDLAVMYFPELDAGGRLQRLAMVPLRSERFRLVRAQASDADWLCDSITRASRRFGTRVVVATDGALQLLWN